MSELSITVSQLNGYVNTRLQNDAFLSLVWIEGEVGQIGTRRNTAYITLQDADASVSCLAFRFSGSALEDILTPGSRVLVRGDVSLYVPSGRFSLVIKEAQPAGEGALLAQLRALQKKLTQAGFFAPERKRPLPPYPREIAVITSAQGAALQDIRKISARRNPSVRLRLYPVMVQGVSAPQSIADAFNAVNEDGTADIVIVARGGGSAADLSAFNDERVVRAVVSARMPVISAVGHETDVTFCDMAADRRASTPSAAAELAVPEAEAIRTEIRNLMAQAQQAVRAAFERTALQLRTEQASLRSAGTDYRLRAAKQQISQLRQGQTSSVRAVLAGLKGDLHAQEQRLSALNPSSILSSGYAVVLKDGRRVYSAKEIVCGDSLELLFKDGRIRVTAD